MCRLFAKTRIAAFTLIELLVVITIIGVLVSLLLPAVQMAREAARRMSCSNNLRQIGIGLQNYHAECNCFPPGCSNHSVKPIKNIAWNVYLLPYIEQDGVNRLFDYSQSFDASQNITATHRVMSIYICPSTNTMGDDRIGSVTVKYNPSGTPDPRDGTGCTDYGGMFGWSNLSTGKTISGVMVYDHSFSIADIPDGTSCTIIIAEDTGRGWKNNGEWADGQNIFDQTGAINASQNNEMWSDHPGGVNTAFCDGSVHFLSKHLALTVVQALCTRKGGEPLGGNEY